MLWLKDYLTGLAWCENGRWTISGLTHCGKKCKPGALQLWERAEKFFTINDSTEKTAENAEITEIYQGKSRQIRGFFQ